MLLEKLTGVVNYNLRKRIINMWKKCSVLYVTAFVYHLVKENVGKNRYNAALST